MKSARYFYLAAICALVFSFSANTFAQSRPGYATVVRLSGEARYSADNTRTWQALVVGMTLSAGDIIQTAGNGTVDLVLGRKVLVHAVQNPSVVAPGPDSPVTGLAGFKSAAEQNVIHIDTSTVLAIDKLTIGDTGVDAVSDTELDLRQGTIFGTVKKLSATSQYLIKIPNGIAGVRGTTFAISANGTITDIAGSMVVSYSNGQGPVTTTVLGPGESFNPQTGGVTQLTQQQLAQAESQAVDITTLDYGFIRFAEDETIVYVSPTIGHF